MNDFKGILLEYGDGKTLTSLRQVQDVLKKFGTGLWPVSLKNIPNELKLLLLKKDLSVEESDQIQQYFQLPIKDLIKTITDAGRKPHLMDGTHTINLYIVKEQEDYSCYDRLHVNVSTNNIGVDEIIQMISGSGYILTQHLPQGETIKLYLDCLEGESAWLLTYSGYIAHSGSLTRATIGTKILVQVLGPKEWEIHYV